MNIKNIFRPILLSILMFSFCTINIDSKVQTKANITVINKVQKYINELSNISSKYESKRLKNSNIQIVNQKQNNNIIDSNTLSRVEKYIKYITQSAEHLKKNIFTIEDNVKLATCVIQVTKIQDNLKQKKDKVNKKQYKEIYDNLNKIIKICKSLQKIGEQSRIVLNKEKLPNDLLNKFNERLQYLLNNKEFMTSNDYERERNLVFYNSNNSNFIDLIKELEYNINSFPLITEKIVVNNTDLFIKYFSNKKLDIMKILDDSENSVKYDFIKTGFNGYNSNTCLMELFYLEQKIYEWFAKEYGELKSRDYN